MASAVSYSIADYIVGTITLMIPLGIGVWYAVKDSNKTTRDEYLLGGRQMSAVPVALSTFITFVSAVSLMGNPAEVFFFGGIAYSTYIGVALSYVVGYFTLVPLMNPLKLTSVYEYLQLRYQSESIHVFCTIIGVLQTLIYQAIVLLLPALALQACADLPLWFSVALIGAIGTVYTTIGGFKSVIWTDAFQTVFVFIGIFANIVKACVEVGGVGEVWRLSKEGGRLNFDKISLDPRTRHTHWSLIIGYLAIWSSNAYGQATVQRMSSLKSLREAKMSFLLNIPLHLSYGAINCFMGLAIYAYYVVKKCDPFEAGLISNKNQIAPYFVLHAMTGIPGMAGLFIGVLCCGSLSSLSSGINSMAANTVQDVLKRPLQHFREATITFVTKLLVLAYGTLAIGMAFFMAKWMQGPATQMAGALFGALGSPIMGIIIMGASIPWANKYGAFAGAISSLCINLWVSLGSVLQAKPLKALSPIITDNCFTANSTVTGARHNQTSTTYQIIPSMMNSTDTKTPDSHDTFFLYDITYEWYPVIGCIVCITIGLIVSFLTNPKPEGMLGCSSETAATDAKYIYPFLRKYWGFSLVDEQDIEFDGDHMGKCDSNRQAAKNGKTVEMENLNPLLTKSHPI